MTATAARARRVRVRVEGVVQGVGFRPFVHRLAEELGLGGTVRNDARGVEIEAEGTDAAVRALLARLAAEAPPLARVESVEAVDVPAVGAGGFTIEASRGGAAAALRQRRRGDLRGLPARAARPGRPAPRYPFVNCTNCGPRFTIVRGVPYDRPLTTMARFAMCDACRAEYDDPRDRRFHAQPNACPACGPRAVLSVAAPGRDAVAAAAGPAPRRGDRRGQGRRRLPPRLPRGGRGGGRRGSARASIARTSRSPLMAGDVAAARALVALGPAEEAELHLAGAAGRARPAAARTRASRPRRRPARASSA